MTAMGKKWSLNAELQLAKTLWGPISRNSARALARLVEEHGFSIACGDIVFVGSSWYVTHPGLLRLAVRKKCDGIDVRPVNTFCDPATRRWAFKATAYKSKSCRGFVGYGDADPANVSSVVQGAEMRVAETRAVNRALRKAYGIGICSVEEIGSFDRAERPLRKLPPQNSNGSGKNDHSGVENENGNGTRVRDRLCQLIRQHNLDAELVKAYAVDFCGTKTLREATREQVENFVAHLADWAEKDRDALLCQLNSYSRSQAGAA
jgi:hypothetical protein